MGNSQTRAKKQSKKNIQIQHPAFQSAHLIKDSSGKQLIGISIPMKSQDDYIQWTKNYKRIPKIHSLLYPEESKYDHKGCCGSSGIANVQYQRYPYVLAQQIAARRNNNQGHFKQQQLWLLLFSLVETAQIFHVRKIKVGDIRPGNVFMSSQGQIKVASQFSYPYGTTNYQRNVTNRQAITYLAPQQVKDIQFGKMKDSNDPALVETFSIGLTVLDAAVLSLSELFYDNNGVFNYDKLNQSLKMLNSIGYSPQLTHIITKMCDPQPANRLKANELVKILRPYQNQIHSRKPFSTKSLPLSINGQSIVNPPNNNNNNNYNPSNNINPNNVIPNNNINVLPNNNIQQNDDYRFVQGVVFDSKQDGLNQTSIRNGKEVQIKTSKITNTYNLSQKQKIQGLQSPVQTTIFYPPITIQLPPPIQQDHAAQQNHG